MTLCSQTMKKQGTIAAMCSLFPSLDTTVTWNALLASGVSTTLQCGLASETDLVERQI